MTTNNDNSDENHSNDLTSSTYKRSTSINSSIDNSSGGGGSLDKKLKKLNDKLKALLSISSKILSDEVLLKKLHQINDDIDDLYFKCHNESEQQDDSLTDYLIKNFCSIFKIIQNLNQNSSFNENKNLILSLIDIYYKKLYYLLSFSANLNKYVQSNKIKYECIFQATKKTLFFNDVVKLTKNFIKQNKKDDNESTTKNNAGSDNDTSSNIISNDELDLSSSSSISQEKLNKTKQSTINNDSVVSNQKKTCTDDSNMTIDDNNGKSIMVEGKTQPQHTKSKIKKTELEILDEKINKCSYETQLLKQKLQNEWSKHMMTKHLDTFYDKGAPHNKSKNEKPFMHESNQIEKNILKYVKKQQVYEKRKEKLLKKIEADQQQQNEKLVTINEDNLSGKGGYGSGSNCSSNIIQSSNDNNNSGNLQKSVSSDDLLTQSKYIPTIKLNQHNNYSQVNMLSNLQQNNGDDNLQFHINSDLSYEDQNNKTATSAIPIIMQYEQDICYIKEQQLKLQSDFDDMQKKMKENSDLIIKELKQSNADGFISVQSTILSVLQTNEQKLGDIKESIKKQFDQTNYTIKINYDTLNDNITKIQSRIESLEKSQKISQINNFDSTNTNYYQLFTKLFDIILTLCAIFLLIINHTVSFIKSVFNSCPRVIVFLICFYILLYNYFLFYKPDFLSKYFFKTTSTNST